MTRKRNKNKNKRKGKKLVIGNVPAKGHSKSILFPYKAVTELKENP